MWRKYVDVSYGIMRVRVGRVILDLQSFDGVRDFLVSCGTTCSREYPIAMGADVGAVCAA